MKNTPIPRCIPRFLRVALSAACALFALGAVGQTIVPASLVAPPSAYTSTSTNFVMRVHEIATARTPGSQNSIANVERQLKGDLGPNLAAAGPNGDGSYTVPFIDYDIADPVTFNPGDNVNNPGSNNLPFPGLVGPTNVAVEVISYLKLPAGTNYLGVRCNESFRLTVGVGDNPRSAFALQPAGAVRDPGGATADTRFSLIVTQAGVYPIRMVYGQGQNAGTLELYYSNSTGGLTLIGDPNDSTPPAEVITPFAPASLPIVPAVAYVSLIDPTPGSTVTSPLPTIRADLTDAGTTVQTNTIVLKVDGNTVVPAITKTGGVTTVSYLPPNILASGSHSVELTFTDSAANSGGGTWSFAVQDYSLLAFVPASWAYPTGSGNPAQPGFNGLTHKAAVGSLLSATITLGDAQLASELIDGNTAQPYVNLVTVQSNVTDGLVIPGSTWFGYKVANNDGTWIETNVINYNTSATNAGVNNGVFTNDVTFPGLPGATDTNRTAFTDYGESAVEITGYIELPAGLVSMGVNHRDAYELSLHPCNGKDVFRKSVIYFGSNQGASGSLETATFLVETNGLYAFRLMMKAYQNTTPQFLEFFSANPTNLTSRILINATNDGAYKSYRGLTVTERPYVKRVTPTLFATGVSPSTTVQVTFVNLGANIPVLKVNGATVSYSSSTLGNETTITYTPPTPFPAATVVNCEVTYPGTTETWRFVTQNSRKALMTVGSSRLTYGDRFIAFRLASKYGVDVEVYEDLSPALNTNLLAGKVLFLNSATVASGNVRARIGGGNTIAFGNAKDIPVPIINWENGNVVDFSLATAVGGNVNGAGSDVNVLTGGGFLRAGLPAGTNTIRTTSIGSQFQRATAPSGSTNVAVNVANSSQSLIYGIPKGLDVGGFVHPARCVHFGPMSNDGAEVFNTAGLKLLDAAIEWLLPPKVSIAGAGGNNATVSWVPDGTLQENSNVTTTNWVDAANQNNPQTIPASGQKYFRVRQ